MLFSSDTRHCLKVKSDQTLSYNRQTLTSPLDNVFDRNLACAILIRHKTQSDGEVRSDTVIQQCLQEDQGLTIHMDHNASDAQNIRRS